MTDGLQTTSSSLVIGGRLTRCPACLAKWRSAGSIRVPLDECADEMLAGQLGELLDELRYERCQTCASLIATDERRDPELLEQIYRTLPDSYWSHLNPQTEFSGTIAHYLGERCSGGDLWDVGCGSGNLLANLDTRWEKHGIEPGARAVELARQRGLDVHAGTASRLGLRDVADAVLMIDVVEHMADPALEFEAAGEMLRHGGTLAVFTGNADAWLPRMARGRWYYLHCIGHVTVFSRAALCKLLATIGFTDISGFRVEHPGGVGLPRWIARAFGNGVRAVLGRPLAAQHYHRDHQLVLASKATNRTEAAHPPEHQSDLAPGKSS
jgi:SAM-dependent methyltransferase